MVSEENRLPVTGTTNVVKEVKSTGDSKMKYIYLMLVTILVTGCASDSGEIRTAHVSPLQYANYNCDQIAMELRFTQRRATELKYEIDDEASGDAGAMAFGLILFWPALFFIDGDDPARNADYSLTKGQMIALEDAAVQKKCSPAGMPPAWVEPERKVTEVQEAPL